MNLDYDEDGNNIVPCPICLDNYCPSKEGGKCPDEDEFARDMEKDCQCECHFIDTMSCSCDCKKE